jgi:hypothetical protein
MMDRAARETRTSWRGDTPQLREAFMHEPKRSHRILALVAGAGTLVGATAVQAQVYFDPYVSANASVSTCFETTSPSGCIARTNDTGYLFISGAASAPALAVSSLLVSDTRPALIPPGNSISGRAAATFEASPGVLRASTSASGTILGSSGLGPRISSRAGEYALAGTNPGATFLDTVTLSGGTPGAAVPVTVSVVFEGVTSLVVDPEQPLVGTSTNGSLFVSSTAGGALDLQHVASLGAGVPFLYAQSFQTLVTVGTPFQISATLQARSEAVRATYTGQSSALFEAMNTAEVFLQAPDGYTLASASGHVYAPVPEPAPAALLLAGVLGLAWLRRRQLR